MADEFRQCCGCRQTKPASDFWKDKSKTCGLSTYCKLCMKEQFRRDRYPRLKTQAAYQFNHRTNQRLYTERHPEVVKAHRVARAHRNSIKKDFCENCGASERQLHMHHPDHSRPLEVITLCVPCHESVHHGATI